MNWLPLMPLLSCLCSLGLAGCSSPIREKREQVHSLPFKKPRVQDFIGQYQLTDQRMDPTLPQAAFKSSTLVLNKDSTFVFTEYPTFANTGVASYEFRSRADYRGRWATKPNGTAYDAEAGIRKNYWTCEFNPPPGGNTELWIDSFVNKRTGLIESVYLYTGDIDSGDYLLYERVPPTNAAKKSKL